MDPQRHPGQRGLHRRRVREDLEEVAARAPEHVQLAPAGSVDHLGGGEAGTVRDGEPPLRGEGGGVLRVDRVAARERGGVGAHLGAALDAGVAPDGHEPGAVPTDVAAGQREVHQGLHAAAQLR